METKKKKTRKKVKAEEVPERYEETANSLDQLKAVEIDPTDDPVYEEIEGLEVREGSDLEEIPDRGAPMPVEPSPKRKSPSMFPEDSVRNEEPSFLHRIIRRR